MPESAGGAVRVGKCPSLQGRGSSRSRHACCDLSPWLSALVLEAVLLTISVRRGEPQNLSSDLVHVQLRWPVRHPASFCFRMVWALREPKCPGAGRMEMEGAGGNSQTEEGGAWGRAGGRRGSQVGKRRPEPVQF